MTTLKKFITIFTILLVAFCLRVVGLNWDQGTFLHPDERFLIMVTQDLKIPTSIQNYLATDSTLQVRNTKYSFYVYGTFPVALLKILAQWFNEEGFKSMTYLGRWLSIITESLTVVLVISLASFFSRRYQLNKKLPLWSGFFYAVGVLPIQLAHFFTTDPFSTFFSLLSLLLITKVVHKRPLLWSVLSGLIFSLALASKLSAIFILPLIGGFILSLTNEKKLFRIIGKTLIISLVFGASTYLGLRFLNPEYFAQSSWFDPSISNLLIKNLKTLQYWSSPDASFPPAMQWLNRTPVLFSLKNIFFFGWGIWPSLLTIIGLFFVLKKRIKSLLTLTLIWTISLIGWQGSQFVQSMRYFYVLYPIFAIFAAIGITQLQQLKVIRTKEFIFNLLMMFLVLLWPLMFMNIFMVNHSRVEATYWIRENLPSNNTLLYEYWDDALPLGYAPGKNIIFPTVAIPIFDQDTPQKWEKINQQLMTADYYILSSNRGWASLSRLEEKYPLTKSFYENLFANKTNYQLVKVFQSQPSLSWLGIDLNLDDSWSEEAFTVYDHPTVYIFKNKLKF